MLASYPERFFEDWNVGDSFVTADANVSREECLEFARRYDPQPFHLDDDAADSSVFRGLAASGWLTSAVTMRLVVESGVMRGSGILGTGVDELRWLAPVYPGDNLHVEAKSWNLRPIPAARVLAACVCV